MRKFNILPVISGAAADAKNGLLEIAIRVGRQDCDIGAKDCRQIGKK